jgi:hypothetical protein
LTKIFRDQLYADVWQTPMWKLAPKYGLSDRGLAKICEKMNIPRPPRGYWVRQEFGYIKDHPKLPPADENTILTYELNENSIKLLKSETESPEIESIIKYEYSPNHRIGVTKTLSSPHPITKKVLDRIGNRPPNYLDLHNFLNLIRVTPKNLKRGLRITDTFLKAVGKRNYINVIENEDKVFFELLGSKVQIKVFEQLKRRNHTPDKNKKYDFHADRKYDYLPTNQFTLEINEWASLGLRKKWQESEKKSIEELFHPFLIGLARYAQALTEYNYEREREWARRRAEEGRRKELELEKQREQERLRQLEQYATLWKKSQDIRLFVELIRSEAEKRRFNDQQKSLLDKWIKWALTHADQIDPINAILNEIEMFNQNENSGQR